MSLSEEDRIWFLDLMRGERAATTEMIQAERAATAEMIQAERAATAEMIRAERAATTEMIRSVETALLTAFHDWASPNEARQRTHAAALRAIDLEMESLSDRVTKLEGGKPL